jgi:hypothetical protein
MEELFKFQHLVMGACMSLPMTPFMGVLQVGHITPKKQTISMEALEQQLQKKKMDTHKSDSRLCADLPNFLSACQDSLLSVTHYLNSNVGIFSSAKSIS